MAKTLALQLFILMQMEAALQVQRGGGGPGEMQLGEFFVRPDVNLKRSQGWKQNSVSTCTGHCGLFNRRTFCNTKASRPFYTRLPEHSPLLELVTKSTLSQTAAAEAMKPEVLFFFDVLMRRVALLVTED